MQTRLFPPLILAASLLAASAHGAEAPLPPSADIAVEASRSAPNDQFRAQVYVEATDSNPGELARKINAVVAQALATARAYPAVKVRSAGSTSSPIYAKSGRSIEAWRMRSTLALETAEAAALSELLGKLQQTMAVGGLGAAPSPETWKRIEDEAIADALAAFEARARLVAASLHRKWKIRHVAVNTGSIQPKPLMAYARSAPMMAAEAPPPAPIEAGDTQISVSVNGQIDLLE